MLKKKISLSFKNVSSLKKRYSVYVIWYPQSLEQGKAQGSPALNVYTVNKGMNEQPKCHTAVSVHSQFDLTSPSSTTNHVPSTSMLKAGVAWGGPSNTDTESVTSTLQSL